MRWLRGHCFCSKGPKLLNISISVFRSDKKSKQMHFKRTDAFLWALRWCINAKVSAAPPPVSSPANPRPAGLAAHPLSHSLPFSTAERRSELTASRLFIRINSHGAPRCAANSCCYAVPPQCRPRGAEAATGRPQSKVLCAKPQPAPAHEHTAACGLPSLPCAPHSPSRSRSHRPTAARAGASPRRPTAPRWAPLPAQNHRMVGVGGDLCGSPSPTLLPKQGHLQ